MFANMTLFIKNWYAQVAYFKIISVSVNATVLCMCFGSSFNLLLVYKWVVCVFGVRIRVWSGKKCWKYYVYLSDCLFIQGSGTGSRPFIKYLKFYTHHIQKNIYSVVKQILFIYRYAKFKILLQSGISNLPPCIFFSNRYTISSSLYLLYKA